MILMASYHDEVYEIVETFKDGKATLKALTKMIEELVEDKSEEAGNKFKGDMFEIFAWMFFKSFKNDPAVGLVEYEPISIEEDFGVDGTGVNANGDKVAVQVKYRHKKGNLILYSEIAKTYTSGQLMSGLDLGKKNSIYVFTNAEDVNPICKKVFGNIVKVLNFGRIDRYVCNNKSFWTSFYDEVRKYWEEIC